MVGDCRRNLVGRCRWIESGVPRKGKRGIDFDLLCLTMETVQVFGASQRASLTEGRVR